MRALVLREFGRLELTEVPEPVPGPGEALIRVAFTGICGSDLHGYTGENGRRHLGQVMGHECSGRVVALGDPASGSGLHVGAPVTVNPVFIPDADAERYAGREQHHPGKTVFGVAPEISAAFGELIAVPVRNVVPLGDRMPLQHGALIEPLAVAVHAVRRIGVGSHQRVLVLGGGPIGQSVVLALRMAGVEQIVVTEPDAGRRELVAALGAGSLDPRRQDVTSFLAEHWGGPADAAIDCVGVSETLSTALASTAMGSTVCLVGMGAQRLEVPAFAISTAERAVVGSFTYAAADFQDAARWIAQHPDLAGRLISAVVPMAQGDAAFAAMARGDSAPGKVLVRMNEQEES